ncbi:hypothetical protein [Williamsia phyllosphaerae]|uniref:DUF2993 domain-containing protein n=1 Tax=Williamsia phyllosphaerae TaxID=885042 RepID=A0ABQ1UTP8_9NOCA|nr:hypothetical protein [Williamsia phyllosphaerae]GGF26545.1 hypothetical protein GCM10007298_23070 [Williamsia phyllosphaerae]
MKIRNRLVALSVAVMAAAALGTVSATQAQAALDPSNSLGINFDADTTTVIAKTGQPVVFPQTRLVTRTDLSTLEGTLNLPQAAAKLKLGPATLANFKISIINASQVTGTLTQGGTADATTIDLDVSQTFQIRLDSVQPFNISTGSASLNLVPNNGSCITAPTTARLKGSLDAFKLLGQDVPEADAHIKGTYTIPPFQNCGPFAGVLNAIIAGPNNSLDVHVTNPEFIVGDQAAARAKFVR